MNHHHHQYDEGESERLILPSSSSSSLSSSSSAGKFSSSMMKKVSIGASLGALALFATSASSSSDAVSRHSPLKLGEVATNSAAVNRTDSDGLPSSFRKD